MIFFAKEPSLKGRLLATLLLPLCAILMVLGIWGGFFIHRVVERVSDRVLSGSLQAISETLAVEEGHLTLDLPPSALGMLENADRDNVYYNVSYNGKLVTGYPELSIERSIPVENIEFRDSTFHGVPIRIASEAKLVPQLDAPVIIQVAETTKNRTTLTNRILVTLVATEIFLIAIIAVLVPLAINWGLKPLSFLRSEIDARSHQTDVDFAPLPLSNVPQEVLPLVSAFNSLLAHAGIAVDTLRRFTADASHQLRAPLSVVRTHVELLSRHSDGSAEMQVAVSDIHIAVKTLQHLIVQLISLAKAERPTSDGVGMHCFDLVECTAAVARRYVTQALAENVELSFETSQETLAVSGNPLFAGEMIANLLDNAIRYGHTGGHVIIRIPDNRGVLEIEDDGPGVPPRDRERIFERFYRLPHNLDREGSGLGLSIVQALGRRMGAAVNLQTPATGRGLKVVVQFRPVRA